MSQSSIIYRVTFSQGEQICQLYSRFVLEESLIGFIELDELIFDEQKYLDVEQGDSISSEMKQQFQGVERTYIPVNSILRIDELLRKDVRKPTKREPTIASISTLKSNVGTPKNDKKE